MSRSNQVKGIAMLVLSAFGFALMSAFVTLAGDLPFFQKALFRNIVAMAVGGCSLLVRRVPLKVSPECRVPLAIRSVTGLFAVLCNYYAINHLMLASSNSLNKLAPLFAIVFAAIFLKEKISPAQIGILCIAMLGSILLIFPNLGTLGFSAFVGLMGGAFSGGTHVSLRALKKHDIDSSLIVFVFCAFSTLVCLVPSLIFWVPMTAKQLMFMLLAGSSCTVAQYALTAAYKYAPPRDISVYDSTQILFSGILGFALFGQLPGILNLIAYALIITASVLMFFYCRKHQ